MVWTLLLCLCLLLSSTRADDSSTCQAVTNTVYLKGEPKSGTTWLEVVCHELIQGVCKLQDGCQYDGDFRKERLYSARWLGETEGCTGPKSRLVFRVDEKHKLPKAGGAGDHSGNIATDLGVLASCVANPRVNPQECVPKDWQAPESSDKYLLILRDPRDMAISAAYFQHAARDKAMLHRYLADRFLPMTAWMSFRWHWLTTYAAEKTLVLWYEDLLSNPHEHMRNILQFFGLPVIDSVVDEVAQRTSFNAMLDLEKKRSIPGFSSPDIIKVRKGQPGEYAFVLDKGFVSWLNFTMLQIMPSPLLARYQPVLL